MSFSIPNPPNTSTWEMIPSFSDHPKTMMNQLGPKLAKILNMDEEFGKFLMDVALECAVIDDGMEELNLMRSSFELAKRMGYTNRAWQ